MNETLINSGVVTAAPIRVAAGLVIFTIRDALLQVLLRRQRAPGIVPWSLPGGAVDVREDLDGSASRILTDQTGLIDVYLEQLYTFACPSREPCECVITVAYYALTPTERADRATAEGQGLTWFPLHHLPQTCADDAKIIDVARQRLIAKLDYSTIAFQFMPQHFTLSELQRVYETILGESLDKRNFRKRVLSLGSLEATEKMRRNGSHRPARLYRLKAPGEVQFIK